jgi:hypothetical protein
MSRLAGRVVALCAAAVLLQAGGTPAHAQQQRPVQLPQDARYGELKVFAYPRAQIGKDTLHLAPGAKIFNTQNLIIMPAAMPAPAQVLYKLDFQGQVAQLWLLTPQEAAQAKKRSVTAKP